FIWTRAVEIIRDHPLHGIGWANYPLVCGRYYDRVDPHFFMRTWAHNLELSTLAETGPLGLLAMLWIWIAAAVALIRRRAVGGLAALLAWLAIAQVDEQADFGSEPECEVLEVDDAPQDEHRELAPAAQIERVVEDGGLGGEGGEVVGGSCMELEAEEQERAGQGAEGESRGPARVAGAPEQREGEERGVHGAFVLGPGGEAGGKAGDDGRFELDQERGQEQVDRERHVGLL